MENFGAQYFVAMVPDLCYSKREEGGLYGGISSIDTEESKETRSLGRGGQYMSPLSLLVWFREILHSVSGIQWSDLMEACVQNDII